MFVKYGLPCAAVLLLAFAVSHVLRTNTAAPGATPPLPPPQSTFQQALAATGIVEANTGSIGVAAPVPGVVAEVFVEVGKEVPAGASLFRLDDRSLQAEVKLRAARLDTARTQ